MDLTESIAPKSDQLNADDLIAGAVTVTIAEVRKGTDEQPVDVHIAEFPGRAYRPSKSMRRVMVMAWGAEAAAYAGRRLTLYRLPSIGSWPQQVHELTARSAVGTSRRGIRRHGARDLG